MGKKLYVGNLPFSTTETSIQELFAGAGKVESAKIIMDRMSGRSKGFGFVEMSTDEEAKQAIDKFNGTELDGRTIKVSEANDKPREGGGGFGGGRRDGGGGGGGYRRSSGGGGGGGNRGW